MSTVSGVGTTTTTSIPSSKGIDEMSSMDFLKLLITQLSNQDPMEPMKNQELLQQLSAIRSLQSNITISENFETLLGHQELASATLLIGKTIRGLDSNGFLVEGKVDQLVMDASGVRVQVGDHTIALRNVQAVVDTSGTVSEVA